MWATTSHRVRHFIYFCASIRKAGRWQCGNHHKCVSGLLKFASVRAIYSRRYVNCCLQANVISKCNCKREPNMNWNGFFSSLSLCVSRSLKSMNSHRPTRLIAGSFDAYLAIPFNSIHIQPGCISIQCIITRIYAFMLCRCLAIANNI